jgi:hypothetical protein
MGERVRHGLTKGAPVDQGDGDAEQADLDLLFGVEGPERGLQPLERAE